MSSFAYSFCLALLHSLWQAGLLWLIYIVSVHTLLRRNHPLDKRNFLFLALLMQFSLFILTFLIYYASPDASGEGFVDLSAGLLPTGVLQALAPWLFAFYLLVVVTKLTRSLYSWIGFRNQYLPGLQKPGIDLKLFTQAKAFQFGIRRKVNLWLSTTIQTPVTFGFLRPVIVLPVALVNHISLEQAETLILHELTHIRTNDYLLNWFLVIMENVFFFNPFIRSLGKHIRLEREKNCDLNVLAFSYSPALYAETLLHAERLRQRVPGFSLAAVQHKKQLLHRIRFFISGNRSQKSSRGLFLVPLVIGLFLLMLVYASMSNFSASHAVQANQDMATLVVMPAGPEEFSWENQSIEPVLAGKENRFMKEIRRSLETQQSNMEKQVKELQPVIREVEKRVEKMVESYNGMMLYPVGYIEPQSDTREVIIKEEATGNKAAAVKVYSMILKDGRWIIVPQWMATARKTGDDSSGDQKKDSNKTSPVFQQ